MKTANFAGLCCGKLFPQHTEDYNDIQCAAIMALGGATRLADALVRHHVHEGYVWLTEEWKSPFIMKRRKRPGPGRPTTVS